MKLFSSELSKNFTSKLCRIHVLFYRTSAVVSSVLLAACSAYDLGSERPLEISADSANPTWENGIQQIVKQRCDNCHAKVQSKFVPGDVKKFNFGMSESEAEFAKHLSGTQLWVFNKPNDPMPPAYADQLTANEKEALKNYVDSKLATKTFNASLCPTNITSTNLTFAADIKPIGDANCKACHSISSNGGAGGGRVVETQEQYKQYRIALSEYMKGVHKGTFTTMPPSGSLSQVNKDKILEWACFSSEAQ
jgi:mono/diheme cytochrome c family protein